MKKILAIGVAATLLAPMFSYDNDRGMHDQDKKKENNDFRFWEENDPMWYVGFGGFAWNELTQVGTTTNFEVRDSVRSVRQNDFNQNQPGAGFIGMVGYQVNKVASFEMFYQQTAWDQKSTDTNTHTPDTHSLDTKSIITFKQLDFGPRTLIAVPIHDYFAPYFMAGFLVGYRKGERNYDETKPQPTTATNSENTWGLSYIQGYGIRSQMTEYFGMRIEYMNTYEVPFDSTINLIAYFSF
jgi:hypothetical protein